MYKFPWGKVIDYITIDLDSDKIEVVKFFPKVMNKQEWEDVPQYHCEKLHASYSTIQALVICWIAYKNLGNNQHTLVSGICRALEVKE